MKIIDLDLLKYHLRIDGDEEDALLEMYGESAEETVMNICNRSYEDFIDQYGDIPTPIRHAVLLIAGVSYRNREAVTAQNMYMVPYSFEALVRPYTKLSRYGF